MVSAVSVFFFVSKVLLTHDILFVHYLAFLSWSVRLMVWFLRTIFNWMSTVIRDFIGFALLRSVIGPENSLHYLNQSEQKLKPVTTWSRAFSRALSS